MASALVLSFSRQHGLADEIVGPLILHPSLEWFQLLESVLLSDEHLSAPPIMLRGAVNTHRCHLPFLFLGRAFIGAGPCRRHTAWLPGCLHMQRALGTPQGGFFSHRHFTGGGRGRVMPQDVIAKLMNFLKLFWVEITQGKPGHFLVGHRALRLQGRGSRGKTKALLSLTPTC